MESFKNQIKREGFKRTAVQQNGRNQDYSSIPCLLCCIQYWAHEIFQENQMLSWDIWARSTICSCKHAHIALSVLPNCMSPFLIYYWCCSQPTIFFNSSGITLLGRPRVLLLWQARIWMVLLLSLKSWLFPSWFYFCLQGSSNWAFLPPLTSPSYIYTYIDMCMLFALFCPPAHLCLCQEMLCKQLEVWRSIEESENH